VESAEERVLFVCLFFRFFFLACNNSNYNQRVKIQLFSNLKNLSEQIQVKSAYEPNGPSGRRLSPISVA